MEVYLGARLQENEINEINCWTISSQDYLKSVIDNVDEFVKRLKLQLPNKVKAQMDSNYIPEFDETPELGENMHTCYQELIGMLRPAIELGRVDILHEISVLLLYQSNPREGHLE